MTRCELCGMPMPKKGATGYCSERCLHWDFFGVPALERDDFLREIRQNQSLKEMPEGYAGPPAYPEFGERFREEVTEALALIKQERDRLKAHA